MTWYEYIFGIMAMLFCAGALMMLFVYAAIVVGSRSDAHMKHWDSQREIMTDGTITTTATSSK